jgi:hypothetical protein
MTGSARSLLSLPPEILLQISNYLEVDAIRTMKSTHPVLRAALPLASRRRGRTPTRLAEETSPLPDPPRLPNLLRLPPELIYEIADHLPPDAILALKLTHRYLNSILSLKSRMRNVTLSSCARLALRTYLSNPTQNATHMRCILCKAVYPLNIFSSSSSPACVPLSLSPQGPRPEVVELPRRFCAWHVGRLAKIVHTEPNGRNEWVSSMREMCMHCGSVRGWGVCICKCDSCWTRSVRTYTRYLNNKFQCRRFLFWRDTTARVEGPREENLEGRLYVRETCWDPGECLFFPVGMCALRSG